MKKPRPTPAQQWREHREIFEYAMAHGLTLIDAKNAIARDRWKAAHDRLAAVRRRSAAFANRSAT
ncbi:hypothetical protein V6U71_04860 [Sphingopyxis sp. J-6]|uniref:hypothetical protein n=1 Tax=Sphingopyxis sp. J-6 TaxID=3122054 RepID=UPI003983FCE2